MSGALTAGVAFVDIFPNMAKFQSALAAGMRGAGPKFAVAGALAGGLMVKGIVGVLEDGLKGAQEYQVAAAAAGREISNAFGDIRKSAETSATKGVHGIKELQQAGIDVSKTLPKVFDIEDAEEWARQIEDTVGVSDEAVIRAEGWLSTFHNIVRAGPAFFKKATAGVADLAAGIAIAHGTTIDLSQAQNLLGKALDDPVKGATALKRVGVSLSEQERDRIQKLTDAGKLQKAQQFLLSRVNAQVKGLGETYGKTLAGSIDRAKEAWADTKRDLATALIPTLTTLAEKLGTVARWLREHPGLVKILAIAIGALGAALLGASVAFLAMTLAASPWLLIGAGIAALLVVLAAGFIYAWRNSEKFRKVVTAVFNAFKATIAAVVGFVREHWKILALILLSLLTAGLGPLVVGFIAKFDTIKQKVTAVVGWIKDKFNGLIGWFSNLPGRISAAASGMWDGIKEAFKSALNSVIDLWNELVGKLHFHFGGIHGHGGFDINPGASLQIGHLFKGGDLGPGEVSFVGEYGPELAVGGRSGAHISALGAGGYGRGMKIEGTLDLGDGLEGKIEGVLSAHNAHVGQIGRMRR